MKRMLVLLLLALPLAAAEDDALQRARALATAGKRAEAIAILTPYVDAHPADDDARTLLGTVLSWDRQYALARQQLQLVLAHDPSNGDARAALANVDRWSTASSRRELQFGARVDAYEDAADWHEAQVAAKVDAYIGRVSYGSRGGDHDEQFELEAYPHLGPKTYAYLAAGAGAGGDLYPRARLGAELFQGLRGGYEVSAGDRWLGFHGDDVNVLTASASKYWRDWLFTLRGYHADGTSAAFVQARRYFGDGSEYVGVRAGRGSTRDEIRSTNDVAQLQSHDVAVEVRMNVGARGAVEVRGGIGKDDGRRRTSLGAMYAWRF